jgi:uncharacterized linocin/CFP29 family protein
MSSEFLQRSQAPIGASVWDKIDEAVVGAAGAQLAGRRLLEVEGPYGLGLTAISTGEQQASVQDAVSLSISPATPVPAIACSFTIPMRDIANFEATGLAFDLSKPAQAAMACARREDDLIFNGLADLGVSGLLTHPGAARVALKQWTAPGDAFANVLEGVNALDANGLHGPYALALAPALYNGLFRLYPDGGPTEMEQMSALVTGGITKAPALTRGAVLLAVGKQFASLVLGQDLMAAYVGPRCGDLEFCLMESLALRVAVPGAVCVLAG